MSPTLLDENRYVARKTHWCDACGGRIGEGDTYMRQRIVDCGDAWVYKAHLLCAHIVDRLALEYPLDEYEPVDAGYVQDELRRYLAVLA